MEWHEWVRNKVNNDHQWNEVISFLWLSIWVLLSLVTSCPFSLPFLFNFGRNKIWWAHIYLSFTFNFFSYPKTKEIHFFPSNFFPFLVLSSIFHPTKQTISLNNVALLKYFIVVLKIKGSKSKQCGTYCSTCVSYVYDLI